MILQNEDLRQFIGTTQYYYLPLFGNKRVYTDGVQFLAEKGECYWLLTDIFAFVGANKELRNQNHFWKLEKVNGFSVQFTLIAESFDGKELFKNEYNYSDFPLDRITIKAGWEYDKYILCLPSED